MIYNTISEIRQKFIDLLAKEEYVIDKTGCKMLEIIGSTFIADEPAIFGTPNKDYISREIEWYKSQSLNVNDIPGGAPSIWKQVADINGNINSNYGWCVWSEKNDRQFLRCLETLTNDPYSRRAIMIYTRPSMQYEYKLWGRSDFMCTNTVQYLIRDDKLHAIVQMRSNDVVFGVKNDLAWQKYVQDQLSKALKVPCGDIFWQTGSLHVYSRHFYLVDHFNKTGQIEISKSKYNELYPESPWK